MIHLDLILNLLSSNHFYAKFSKCHFGVPTVNYLGHIISIVGIAPDNDKITAIFQWSEPHTLTALWGFLGTTRFCRWFVQNYATLAAPLTNLLRSNQFSWPTEAATTFTTLQRHMAHLPTLALPNFDKPFV